MTIFEITKEYDIDYVDFLKFLKTNNLEFTNGASYERSIKDENVVEYVNMYNSQPHIAKPPIEKKLTSESSKHKSNTETKKQITPSSTINEESQKVNNYSLSDYDILLKIASIRRMGLISIICAFINPIISLICGIVGKKYGNEIYGAPQDLRSSLIEAIEYNKQGINISVILLVIDVIAAIIGAVIMYENY